MTPRVEALWRDWTLALAAGTVWLAWSARHELSGCTPTIPLELFADSQRQHDCANVEEVPGSNRKTHCDEMALEIDHVGAIVDVTITSGQQGAHATLFAVSLDGSRITATPARMGAGGPSRGIGAIKKRYAGPPLPEDPDARQRVLDAYRVQRHDVEDAVNQMLGRDPEMHRPPRLSWDPLVELLADHGKVVSERELIAMAFRFDFSAEALAALEEE